MDQPSVQTIFSWLTVAFAVGFVLSPGRGRLRRVLQAACALCLIVCILGSLEPKQRIVWDGGYGQGEIEVTFRNPDGVPVPGVRLRVEDEVGRVFFLYPVSDYLPDHVPTSDADGRMVFHHVASGVEFSGVVELVASREVVVARGPVFICRFLLGDVGRRTQGHAALAAPRLAGVRAVRGCKCLRP